MNSDGLSFVNLLGGLLTHSANPDYGMTDENLKEFKIAVDALMRLKMKYESDVMEDEVN